MEPPMSEAFEADVRIEPAEQLERLVEAGDVDALNNFYYQSSSGELARAISLLDEEQQSRLFKLLDAEIAADLVEELSHTQAADILEELEPREAAAIIDEMPSDEQADLLGTLDVDDARAILEQMDPEEAQDARRLAAYDPETAGGLMISEYLVYPHDMLVEQVLADLRANVEKIREYDVQYLYVVNHEQGELIGTVRLKDLVLSPGKVPITSIRIDEVQSVRVDADLDQLETFFDRYDYFAAPVVDEQQRLVGVVRRAYVEEALGDRTEETMMRLGGIVAGEELRTMPTFSRALRRMAFLFPTMLLALVAISVIAAFEETIEKVPALAIFLPLVAGLCGGSGNQAVAVSMRELSLGLVEPADYVRVCIKEIKVGALIGIGLGIAVFFVALIMRPEVEHLALVVGAAVPLTVIIAVCVGGAVPLIFRGIGIDPAMVSGSIVTMTADLCGFFTVLMFARAVLT
jgi:magnesium transporter